MEATIKVVGSINDISECRVNGHQIDFGGPGDGYCYEHQSFKCLENLSPEEKEAIDRMVSLLAERVELVGLSQRQVADLVGSTPKHVNLVFNGKATAHPNTLDEWANALQVRFDVNLVEP